MTRCLREETALALVQGELASVDAVAARTHVDTCEPCRQVLAALARMPTITRLPPGRETTEAPLRVADRYELGGVLGAGGMGIVFEARDTKLARIVALKRVKHDHDDAQDRLVREALAMAQLSHPSVVSVFDAGIADGAAYVAMEYVAGETLRGWLAKPRSWREVTALFVEAARGLEAAHAAGIVHGDFKPDNVLVDAHGRARVADFGMARTISEAHRELGGTPAYMAPELLDGAPASAASDQYAWAISLHEALHGVRPSASTVIGKRAARASAATTAKRGGAIAVARGRVPTAVARIVARGIALEPAERFGSMAEAAAALAAVPRRRARTITAAVIASAALGSAGVAWVARGGDELPTCSDGTQELAAVWSPERAAQLKAKLAASGRAELGESVVSTLNAYGERWRIARKAACEATRAGEQSGELLDRKIWCFDQRRESLREVIGVVDALQPTELDNAMPTVLGLPGLDRCSDRGALLVQPKLPASADARRELRALEAELERAHAEANAGRSENGRKHYHNVIAGAQRIAWPPLEAEAWMWLGHFEIKRNNIKVGDDALAKAIDAASRAKDDRLVADTLIKMLVAVLMTTVQTAEAERMIKLADAAVTRAGDDPQLRSEFHQAAGHLLYLRHQRAEGEKHFDKALAILEKLPGDQRDPIARLRISRATEAIQEMNLLRAMAELDKAHVAIGDPVERSPNAGLYLMTLCMARMFLQQHDKALPDCTRARDIFAERVGPDHPDTAAAEGNLGTILLRQGRGAEALKQLERSFTITLAAYGAAHPTTIMARGNLADAYGQLGQHAKARDHWKEVLVAREQALGKDHPKVAEAMQRLAGSEIETGNREGGVKLLEASLPVLEKHLGRTDDAVVAGINALAMAYTGMGRRKDAVATFERAKALLIERGSPDDPNVGLITYNIAEIGREDGQLARALAQYDEVARIWSKGLPPTHALFGHLHTARGETLLALKRAADAIEPLELALPIRTAAGDAVATAWTELVLAEALLGAKRDRARARTLVESAIKHLDAGGPPGDQHRARAEKLRKQAR
ncbi:MAG TPA: serine/threonine-protein kinase [Kofleriaceae bacterium]